MTNTRLRDDAMRMHPGFQEKTLVVTTRPTSVDMCALTT
jgi:hypothetical protein